MCDPFTIIAGVAGAGASLFQGIAGYQSGQANAGMARAQGKAALYQSQAEASNLAQRGAYQLGGMRRDVAGTGNVSALDIIGASATNLAMDVERVKHGGRVAQSQAKAEAAFYKRGAIGSLIGGVVGAGTQLLTSFGGGGTTASLQDKYPIIGKAKSFMPSLAAKY